MAFVSKYPDFPFFLAKLLIPSVSGYQGRPENYLYPRDPIQKKRFWLQFFLEIPQSHTKIKCKNCYNALCLYGFRILVFWLFGPFLDGP